MTTTEQQQNDSDMIFDQISSGDFSSMDEVRATLAMFYVPDMTISRAGISHALKRLEKHFKDKTP